MAALEQVTRIPVIKADGVSLTMSFFRCGAMAERIPMLIACEAKLEKEHKRYLAIK